MMDAGPPFRPKEMLRVLCTHEVNFVIIGGVGSTLHGAPFSTRDLDIVPAMSLANLSRLGEALQEMDAKMRAADEPDDLNLEFTGKALKRWLAEFRFLNLSTIYGYLDLLFRPAGTDGYRDLTRAAVTEEIGEIEVRVASLADIIRSKQAVSRRRDLEQLPTLRRLYEEQTRAVEEDE